MQILWWYWIIGIAAGLLIGAFIASIVFFIYSWLQNRKLKNDMPDIHNPEIKRKVLFAPGPSTQLDKKEAEQDERNRFDKYREFEKLRRAAQGKGQPPSSTGLYDRSFTESERSEIQNNTSDRVKTTKANNPGAIEFD